MPETEKETLAEIYEDALRHVFRLISKLEADPSLKLNEPNLRTISRIFEIGRKTIPSIQFGSVAATTQPRVPH